jgi:hypothetical protein
MRMAPAIARMEGYNIPGSVAQRNNNPGNLRAAPNCAGKDASGYCIFSGPALGWQDLYRQIQLNINRGLTMNEFFAGKPGVYAGYAPSADNNRPYQYAAFVAAQAGVPVDVPLNALDTAGGGGGPDPLEPSPDSQPVEGDEYYGEYEGTGMETVDLTTVVVVAGAAIAAVYFMSRG